MGQYIAGNHRLQKFTLVSILYTFLTRHLWTQIHKKAKFAILKIWIFGWLKGPFIDFDMLRFVIYQVTPLTPAHCPNTTNCQVKMVKTFQSEGGFEALVKSF